MSLLIGLFRRKTYGKSQFAALIQPHIETMYKMAWQWTGCEDDAEDLIQDVLVNLAGRVREMDRIEQLRPWLVKVVYNRYVDIYRRNKKSPLVPWEDARILEETIEPGTDEIGDFQQSEIIRHAIRELSPEQRDTIILHDVQGFSEEETAQRLSVSTGTVKSRLHRARRKMRQTIEQGTFSLSDSL